MWELGLPATHTVKNLYAPYINPGHTWIPKLGWKIQLVYEHVGSTYPHVSKPKQSKHVLFIGQRKSEVVYPMWTRTQEEDEPRDWYPSPYC